MTLPPVAAPTLDALPRDVHLSIFSYATPSEILSYGLVCKRFGESCADARLWRIFVQNPPLPRSLSVGALKKEAFLQWRLRELDKRLQTLFPYGVYEKMVVPLGGARAFLNYPEVALKLERFQPLRLSFSKVGGAIACKLSHVGLDHYWARDLPGPVFWGGIPSFANSASWGFIGFKHENQHSDCERECEVFVMCDKVQFGIKNLLFYSCEGNTRFPIWLRLQRDDGTPQLSFSHYLTRLSKGEP